MCLSQIQPQRHLQMIVVMETKRFVLYNPRIQAEAGRFQTLSGARMAGVEDGHVILLCQLIDSRKQGKEILLCINILLPVCGQKDILAGFQSQFLQYIGFLNLGQILMEHFRHRAACHIDALFR